MTDSNNDIIRELLIEGLDDWVPVDQVIWYARESEQTDQERDFRETTLNVLQSLMSRDLMALGDIGESGFEAWTGTVAERVERASQQLRHLDWKPQGGAFWLANTPAGEKQARTEGEPGPDSPQ